MDQWAVVSAVMPRVLTYRIYIKTHTDQSTEDVHTKEYIHYAKPRIRWLETNIQYIYKHALTLPLGVKCAVCTVCTDTYHK